jgi:cytochrome c peroxidase
VKRFLAALLAALLAAPATAAMTLSQEERRAILQHGPWPAPWTPDPSNRVSGKPAAIELGERLFFEPRLSTTGKVLCATCHAPFRDFQDGRARAFGHADVDRNTQGLLNVRYGRWFGWDGAGDSLWAQSLRPMLDAREMDGSAARAVALLREDAELACQYRQAFGRAPAADDASLFADVGKALAAFQETLLSGRAPFDDYRDALASGDTAAAARYPAAALRGLRLFVGRGNCAACHTGPAFTNGEFHDTGVPFFLPGGGVDSGRHGGIRKLLANPYNLLGAHSDDPKGSSDVKTRHVDAQHRNFGEFKTPSLRNVARTAPYMHNGSLPTLQAVVRHYSELSPDRVHQDGENLLLRPLRLKDDEVADLVAFLESLTEKAPALPPKRPLIACR